MAVADIFSAIIQRIAGQSTRDEMVTVFQKNGWLTKNGQRLIDHFDDYHDLASVEQRGPLAGHSQFEGAFSLKSLNQKYFEYVGDRTIILSKVNLPGATVAISNLGDPPNLDYAFGLKAVLPYQADHLLWWAIKRSMLWRYFSEPTDLRMKSWGVFDPSIGVDRSRPFSKCVLGKADFRLGPSTNEERFYLAAFGTSQSEQEIDLRQGSYLAYHVL
ncbi:hypothetical protein [Ruegeria conchae]|uniref:hypothetical protein n=1 Tax=Ruegeria conchae TaxID=981384 RepID=UPI0029C873D2|nr:hypothetical protein [Ruegeria conchae]